MVLREFISARENLSICNYKQDMILATTIVDNSDSSLNDWCK
jgi:hypothetical protein